MSGSLHYLAAAATAAGLTFTLACQRTGDPTAEATPSPPPIAPQQAQTTAETIESSGLILGIGIGMQMSEARAKLDPLRQPTDHELDGKEQAGTRIYWKLNGTEYNWIMAWANKAGQITRVRANPRPDKPKPFAEVGDLSRAAAVLPQQAMWNVERPGGMSYRLIAQGDDLLARSVYMFALNLDMR